MGMAWSAPTDGDWPRLASSAVQIWRASLHASDAQLAAMSRILTPDELARAGRRVTADLQRRAIVSRALLRIILARASGRSPNDLQIVTTGRHQKPALATGELTFNVAHSNDLALYALAIDRAVGVDIEAVNRPIDDEGIVRRYFAPPERAELATLTPTERHIGFLRMWARKEAYAKARGDGITLDFRVLDVSTAALASAPLLRPLNDAADTPGWRVLDLDPRDGFVGALAVAGSDAVISTWHCPDDFVSVARHCPG